MLDFLRRLFHGLWAPRDPYSVAKSVILHRNLREEPLDVRSGSRHHVWLSDGSRKFDASTGAAVACLGYGPNKRVKAGIDRQWDVSYTHSLSFGTDIVKEFGQFLIDTTDGQMARVVFYNSGSDAVEAAIKYSIQHFYELPIPQPERVHIISRKESYHGGTGWALSASGHEGRRRLFKAILHPNFHQIPACNTYREMGDDESIEAYNARKAKELEDKIKKLGKKTVAAFIAEPVVGAALGCVPAPKGYFKAMKQVCEKYGVLFIADEIMCGMGRCGTMHAWQQEDIVPDISVVGKVLGGGYLPISAMFVGHKVNDVLENGSAEFAHGHTFQDHPLTCAAAFEVQKIIRDENLLENVRKMGALLFSELHKKLDSHPNVLNIRGKGLFVGLEFGQNKATKEPFHPYERIAWRLQEKALQAPYNLKIYSGQGTVDGIYGDHTLIAPAFNITEKEVHFIADTLAEAITDFFDEYESDEDIKSKL